MTIEGQVSGNSDEAKLQALIDEAIREFTSEGIVTFINLEVPGGIHPAASRITQPRVTNHPGIVQQTHLDFADSSRELVYSLNLTTYKTPREGVYIHRAELPNGGWGTIVGPLRAADCF